MLTATATDLAAWDALKTQLWGIPTVGIALSGGVDSRFLCHATLAFGIQLMAFHIAGPHVSAAETTLVRAWAGKYAVPLTIISFSPLGLPAVQANTQERCYQCKHALFSSILQQWTGVLADGSTYSDATLFRPGKKALLELGIHSPLAAAGISKMQLRRLAEISGLEAPHQTSRPCLLTRFAYGLSPSPALLYCFDLLETTVTNVLQEHTPLENIPAFRVRLVAENTVELHLHCTQISGSLEKQLRNVLENMLRVHSPEIKLQDVRCLHTLSGYFDAIQQPVYS